MTLEAITKAGFIVPEELNSIPGSNVPKNKHYDQIAYYKRLARLRPTWENRTNPAGEGLYLWKGKRRL